MNVGAVGGVRPQPYTQSVRPTQSPSVGKDADGDNDGTKPGAVDMKDVGRHLDVQL